MSKAPWILFCLALCAVIYLMTCNRPAPTNMVPQSQFKAMEQRLKDTSAAYADFRRQSDSARDNATAMAIQAGENLKEKNDSLNDKKETVKWLLSELDKADALKQDSSWVSVSPRYKGGCDSLREVNKVLLVQVDNYQQGVQQRDEILAYEVHLRDSIIDRERGFNKLFQQTLQDCIAAGKKSKASGQPRNQLYAGFGVVGSQVNPFAGGEVNLSLKTKSDQIYEVRGALILSTWYVGAGTKFKLHF